MATTQNNAEDTITWSDGLPDPGNPILSDQDSSNEGYQFTKWGAGLGTEATITFSIPGNLVGNASSWTGDYSIFPTNEPTNMSLVNAAVAASFEASLQAWANVANLTFTKITEVNGGAVGVFRVAYYNAMSEGAAGWAYTPTHSAVGGDIWLNPDDHNDPPLWSGTALNPGGAGFATLLHEVGHALGLSHPGGGDGAAPGYDNRTTIMSYNSLVFRDVTPGQTTWKQVEASTPMIYDIAAIQYLYGANTTFNNSDNTYSFDSAVPFFQSIWDAGGVDTISVSNFTLGCEIDLRPGQLSSIMIPSDPLPNGVPEQPNIVIYDGTDNLGIAFNCIIENAIGGSGNDTLVGNNADNTLTGNGGNDILEGSTGNDTLNGGDGLDVAVFLNASNQAYILSYQGKTYILPLSGNAYGRDILTGIEQLNYSNGSVATPADNFSPLEYIASHTDLINAYGANAEGGLNHFTNYGYLEGRSVTFEGLRYIASHGDLIDALGTNAEGGAAHFINYGFHEGRTVSFDGLRYIASHGDLIDAMGTNTVAAATHFINYGFHEGRTISFDGLRYIASYGDLIDAMGTNAGAGVTHFISNGFHEGRSISFDGLRYIASHGDLIDAMGTNTVAAATHFINYGFHEGRSISFDGLRYIASYGDLIDAMGTNAGAGVTHFISNGFHEGRSVSFDGLRYIASYGDLINAYGANAEGGATHFINYGFHEGRGVYFNPVQYLDNYQDLQDAFGSNLPGATMHYISNGLAEGRVWNAPLLTINGGAGDDVLTGNGYDNVMNGGGGSDTLRGGLGNDTLTGGTGSDNFIFNTALNASANRDTITDYDVVTDVIQLDDDIFTAIGDVGALTVDRFYAGTAAHDADDRIIYDNGTGNLYYDLTGNVTGGDQIQFAVLSTHPALDAGDFTIVA